MGNKWSVLEFQMRHAWLKWYLRGNGNYEIIFGTRKVKVEYMMSKIILSVFAVLLMAAIGCRRADVREFVVEVPEATAADEAALRQALESYEGIKLRENPDAVKFDAAKHQLTVRYDSMQLAKKNIEISIAEAGFTANGVTPESVGAKSAKAPAQPAK